MIDDLFQEKYGANIHIDNKQYKHFIGKLVDAGKIKINSESYRIKTFSMKEAGLSNDQKRDNVKDHWGKSTLLMSDTSGTISTRSGENFDLF